ncbi:MAG: hypothetical protein RBU37_23785 [Myxococcota bacterium]|jgi:hypothetical protein|nr:hypothetical protein [Myxococcota bacterium]
MLEDTEVAAAAVGVVTVAAILDSLTKDQQTELPQATLSHIEKKSGTAGLRLIQVLVDQGAANSVLKEVVKELEKTRDKDDRVYWERHVDKVTAKLESKALSHAEAGGALRAEYDQGEEPQKRGTVSFVSKVSAQKQKRHLEGSAPDGKSYLRSLEEAQQVLDAYNSGNYELIDENPSQATVRIRVAGIEGRYINVGNPNGLPDLDLPTQNFMIQSSQSPKVVPINPDL